ncbi:conserved hypothetical protein [Cupriavidus taiwanensis]|uniref:glycosyltransferase family 2 protein n=1 Tax=Cupriavidus taiwanensis TaxID=164546 RepID=UPI000E1A4B9E|nr:glycosyltransferase family 2 protein [Cupriavidus taiwanensis]SOZ98478.1 conserved hypothetical protein [Cupriavidus taiwanensis]
MSEGIKLSVIMPVYNEERYLAGALESVLYQDVDFDFEIIVIDDCSTDCTVEIVKSYQALFPQVLLLQNERNMGKGFSFRRGYAAAAGKYFHVLDGDDIFISYDKLQRQVDFLERNDDHVAIAHNTILLHEDSRISLVSQETRARSYSYEQAIRNEFYCHTSSFMFRKIHSELPEAFLAKPLRGDSAVFFYHVFHSRGKVAYTPDISSIYNFHGAGLWSGIGNLHRHELTRHYYRALLDLLIKDRSLPEYQMIEEKLSATEATVIDEDAALQPEWRLTLDEVIAYSARNAGKIYGAELYAKAFRGMYGLRLVDQLCEAVGRIIMLRKGYLMKDRAYNERKVVLLIAGLRPNGGGIFEEIKDLVQIYLDRGWHVDILSSNLVDTDDEVLRKHFSDERIRYWKVAPNLSYQLQVEQLIDAMRAAAPARIHPFITHHDAVMNAAVQRGLGKAVIVDFVYDHGLSFGVSNSAIDRFILKTESQINALVPTVLRRKALWMPPFLRGAHNDRNPYVPLRKGRLTTASAAARAYKVQSQYRYRYSSIIPEIMKVTGGTHYHYGPLGNEFQQEILDRMARLGIDADRFVHIPWADHFGQSLLDNSVDLFVSPFPVASARIAIEVMSCGIPLMNHDVPNTRLPVAADFCDRAQYSWVRPADLYATLARIDADDLRRASESAWKYFLENNEFGVAGRRVADLRSKAFVVDPYPAFVLRDLTETNFYRLDEDLFVDPAQQAAVAAAAQAAAEHAAAYDAAQSAAASARAEQEAALRNAAAQAATNAALAAQAAAQAAVQAAAAAEAAAAAATQTALGAQATAEAAAAIAAQWLPRRIKSFTRRLLTRLRAFNS